MDGIGVLHVRAAAAKAQRVAVDAAQHVPLYAVSPGFELLHKVASAMLVVALLFGLYKVEYPDARPSEIVASVQEAAIAQGAALTSSSQPPPRTSAP